MKRPATKPGATPQVRVAIYCRQSVASDLEFGSIDAQREAVAAYVMSQRGEGWVVLPQRYDDHGFSGGDTDRPAFQRLMADVEAGKVDTIAIYKLDRLSRSLLDFAHIVDVLQKHGVAMVAVTQQFSTQSSMGKLTLNILMSFAEFEREVISERTKDKVLASRRKGLFTGGRPILGYDVVDGHLVVNADEAATVREIFRIYLEHGGLVSTVAELERRGVRTKAWTNKRGGQVHGRAFNKSSLRALLANALVTGRIRCGDELVAGRHEAIVDIATFEQVAVALREHRLPYREQMGKWCALLTGMLRCARCGAAMTHSVNVRGKRVYRYFICVTAQKQGAAACRDSRANASELEDVVVAQIQAIGRDPSVLIATLSAAREARRAREPELVAEARRVTNERTQLQVQRTNLLDALQHGGAAANTIAGRLAELDERLGRLDARHAEVAAELAVIQNQTVDETAIRSALQQFSGTWDALAPRERARVLRLLIEKISYDGPAGEVTIAFRDHGISALANETTTRRPA